jgi:transcriptional regulator with XRE-family HTH domain
MVGLGQNRRRLRELLGLSQEQLAKIAGVSQGAISRLEAGRGLATPLLVVMKINVALKHALRGLDSEIFSEEFRRLTDTDERIATSLQGGGFKDVEFLKDRDLEEMIRTYQDLPEGQRRTLLSVIRAVSSALKGENATPEWRGARESIPGLSD